MLKRRLFGKRISVAILIVIMLFNSVLTGCGNGKSKEDATKGNDNKVTTEATTQAPTEALTTEPTKATQAATQPPTSAPTEAATKNGEVIGVSAKGYSIRVISGITYVNGILIANKTYGLPKSYAPGGIDKTVSAAFNKMKEAAAKEGLNLWIASGYRSYDYQNNLYNNYVKRDGKEKADTYSARAGHSEHQTGLCFDLNQVNDTFASTRESAWVNAHAHEYGFIVRYPKGKEHITGYKYEPWHLRYLGVELATSVYNSGLCLEEYLGITSEYQN